MKRAGTRNMYFILLGLTETEMMPCFEVSVVFRLKDTLVGSLQTRRRRKRERHLKM